MAKVILNPILKKLRGQVGDLVFRRYGEQVVLSQKPERSEAPPTEGQLAARKRFRQAALYGRIALAESETRVLYEQEAKKRGQPVFSVAVADFFNPPEVYDLDVSAYGGATGDSIVIQAGDDFDVLGVEVSIFDGDGALLEGGPAAETPADSSRWVYLATTTINPGAAVRIEVSATDRPGTATTAEESKTL
ncbi:MAG: hypothetical protein HY784_09005 [Chloroflexi bacterium]|nr:hypothetical protein [Chloroflexota bacterium]